MRSSEGVESSLAAEWDSLGSSEFLCDVVERATFCLRKANEGEGEGGCGHGHEEQVDVPSAQLLFGATRLKLKPSHHSVSVCVCV